MTRSVEHLIRDVGYAMRSFARAPLAALTIVGTIGLGLGLVTVAFTFYSALFLRVDAVRNPHELFEIRRPPEPGSTRTWVPFTRRDYDALRRDTTVFADAFAMLHDVEARINGQPANGTLVTGNFFTALGVSAALGRAMLPDDDERFAGRPVIVLSNRGWIRLFARDPKAVGQTVLVNGTPYQIIGVAPPGFRGLGVLSPDFWAPLDLLDQLRSALSGKEDAVGLYVIGRLRPEVSPEAATANLTAWASANPDMKEVRGRPKTIYLKPSQGTASDDVWRGLLRFTPIFIAFGLILMIACANVANLLLARGVARQREIGIRLSLGASRARIIRQLLTESLLLALLAAGAGFAVSRIALEASTRVAVATVQPAMAEMLYVAAFGIDWQVLIFLVFGAAVATVLFGLVPALSATRLELVRTVRGELMRDARPGVARSALIAVQVCASALLLISAAVFLRSALSAANQQPGLRTVDTLLLEMPNESARTATLQAVHGDPLVRTVAASWPHGVGGQLAEARGEVEAPVNFKVVTPEYFEVFDIAPVRGRLFSASEREPGAGVAVISETTARGLWPGRDPLGQILLLDPYQPQRALKPGDEAATPQLPLRAFTVIGVVPEARVGLGMFEMVDAGVYVPVGAEAAGTSLVIRVHGDPDQARQLLTERLGRVDPSAGLLTTMRSIAGRATYVLQVSFWVTVVLGAIALILTTSGLFSVLSYVVAQRSKEIGVRMALGANTRNIAAMVLGQSFRPVAAGMLSGAALVGSLVTILMSTSAAENVVSIMKTFDPLAYSAGLFCIGAACMAAALFPALRAARIDPVATLRDE